MGISGASIEICPNKVFIDKKQHMSVALCGWTQTVMSSTLPMCVSWTEVVAIFNFFNWKSQARPAAALCEYDRCCSSMVILAITNNRDVL